MSPELMQRLGQVRGVLTDMDGTLYVGPSAKPGAVEFMEALRRNGLPRVVLTNNSSRDGELYVERLRRLGIGVRRNEVLTSGDASAEWLATHTAIKRPFILGAEALRTACANAGIPHCPREHTPDAVLLGYDIELTYARLSDACLLVAEGLPYYATHADRTCIEPEGLLPDAGAFIAAIEVVTRRRPIILGKPTRAMLDAGLSRLGVAAEHTLVIGDQLDTDISLGRHHGVLCALVMTGETSAETLAASDVQPDLVVPHVGALHGLLAQAGVLPPPVTSG
jgi:HAD superfamily hydrolase (TIGR01450 family)